MKDFMVFCAIVIGMLIMAAICFRIAKSKKVQRFMLDDGQEWILGQVDKSIIEEMKQIATEALKNKDIIIEASKKYTIVIAVENEVIKEIGVKYRTATVTNSNEGLKVFDTGISDKRAREMTCFCLCIIVYLIGIAIAIAMGVSGYI